MITPDPKLIPALEKLIAAIAPKAAPSTLDYKPDPYAVVLGHARAMLIQFDLHQDRQSRSALVGSWALIVSHRADMPEVREMLESIK